MNFRGVDSLGLRLGLLWAAHSLALPMRTLHRLLLPGVFGKRLKMGRGSNVVSRNMRVGHGFSIGKKSEIVADTIEIGDNVEIGDDVRLHSRHIVLKNNSIIGNRTVIYGSRTPASRFELGENSTIYPDCYFNTDDAVVFGDRTAAGGYCLIFTHSSYLPKTSGYPVTIAPVTIGADTWLPWHAFILPGVTIGDGATVGAFSLVASDVPDYSLAVGVPARIVKDAQSYRRRYDDEAMEDLCVEIIDKVATAVAGAFRKRTLFAPDPRTCERISESEWVLCDRKSKSRVIFLPAGQRRDELSVTPSSGVLFLTAGLSMSPVHGANWADLVTFKSQRPIAISSILREIWGEFSLYGIRFDWWTGKESRDRQEESYDSP